MTYIKRHYLKTILTDSSEALQEWNMNIKLMIDIRLAKLKIRRSEKVGAFNTTSASHVISEYATNLSVIHILT